MEWMQTRPIRYPTSLSDEEWEQIKSLVPAPKSGKGKRGRPITLERTGKFFGFKLCAQSARLDCLAGIVCAEAGGLVVPGAIGINELNEPIR